MPTHPAPCPNCAVLAATLVDLIQRIAASPGSATASPEPRGVPPRPAAPPPLPPPAPRRQGRPPQPKPEPPPPKTPPATRPEPGAAAALRSPVMMRVDELAELLRLHPKTLLGAIVNGKSWTVPPPTMRRPYRWARGGGGRMDRGRQRNRSTARHRVTSKPSTGESAPSRSRTPA